MLVYTNKNLIPESATSLMHKLSTFLHNIYKT